MKNKLMSATRNPVGACMLVVALLAGCTTVYEGSRMSPEGVLENEAKAGIPFTLPKPEFKVERDGADTPQRYKVAVTYVPDPTQRYTLRLSPALLANVEFGLDLGEQGEVSKVSGKTTEQVTPAIKSLFSFVGGVLGAATSVAALSPDTAKTSKAFSLSADPMKQGIGACLTKGTLAEEAQCVIEISQCPQSAKNKLTGRIGDYIAVAENGKKKDKGDLLGSLHYLNADEKACLGAADTELQINYPIFAQDLQKALNNKFPNLPNAPSPPLTAALVAALQKAANPVDVERARRLLAGLAVAAETSKFALLERELGAKGITANPAELETLKAGLSYLGIIAGGKPAAPFEQLAQTKKLQTGLAHIVALDTSAWRARHLVYLGEELDKLLLLELSGQASAQQKNEVEDLRMQAAVTAGKASAFVRLTRLENELNAIPPARASNRISRYDDYAKARQEAERLRTEIAQASEALIASGKPKAAPPGALPSSVAVVNQDCLDSSAKNGWIYGEGATAPEFVIVLRRPLTEEVVSPKTALKFGACL